VDLESRLRLDRDVLAVQAELESCGGELVRRNEDPAGLFWAVLQPVNRDRAPFIARIQWTVYPDREPSVLFAVSIGGPTTDLAGWPAAQALARAREAAGEMLQDVSVFDVYEGKGIEPGKKSIAIAVTMQPRDKTMTDAEIDALAAKIVAEVSKKTGGVLRGRP